MCMSVCVHMSICVYVCGYTLHPQHVLHLLPETWCTLCWRMFHKHLRSVCLGTAGWAGGGMGGGRGRRGKRRNV